MSENVLKAVVDSIAEAVNELAGLILTRLRFARDFGRDDALVAAAAPTTLTSLVNVFDASMVGEGIDLLIPRSGTPTGNEGSYLIGTYVDEKNVALTNIDGSAPSFVNEDPIRFRFTTLKTETVFDFPTNDRLLQLWVGEESEAVPYTEVILSVGAHEFRGLGAQQLYLNGEIDTTTPNDLVSPSPIFTAAMVGHAIWVLPTDTPNGNEGPQLIASVSGDEKTATLSPGGFVTTEENVRFAIKTYSETGYLTQAHREWSEVIDGSGSYSGLDQLRRALLVGFATEEELDRIGRNLAVVRLRGMADETYRCLLKTLSYLPKATVYGLELVLECLFPGGQWAIYEDLVNFPNTVFILLPLLAGDSTEFEGKAFLAPTGKDVVVPIDSTGIGRGQREKQTSGSTTAVTVAFQPITVVDVLQEDVIISVEMDVLPSADTPAWTYIAENLPAEGTVFSIVATGNDEAGNPTNALAHTQPGAPTDEGGRYRVAIAPDFISGSIFEISAFFKINTLNSEGGFPWGLFVADSAINAQYGLWWSSTSVGMGGLPGAITVGPITIPTLDDGQWHSMLLRRETVDDTHWISAYIDGQNLFGRIDASTFPGTVADLVSFGYFHQATTNQDWTAHWDRVRTFARTNRNHWNVTNRDGVFLGGNDNLRDIPNAPFLASDATANKRVRVRTVGSAGVAARKNVGLWQISAFVAANEVTLAGIQSDSIVTVSTVGSDNFVDLLDPLFIPEDDVKQIQIFDSTAVPSNNGTRNVLEYVSPYRVRVDGGAFVSEAQLSYRFNPNTFVASTLLTYELIDVGTFAGTALTLRDPLPAASTDVLVWYTTVLSAQILRNEFVTNEGSAGSAGNVYYPFYVFDVDSATRQLLDEITAAGVIPEYERIY